MLIFVSLLLNCSFNLFKTRESARVCVFLFAGEKVNRILKFQLYLIKSCYPTSAFVIFFIWFFFLCFNYCLLLLHSCVLISLAIFFLINRDKHSNFWLKPAARFIYSLIEYVQKGALLGRVHVSFIFFYFSFCFLCSSWLFAAIWLMTEHGGINF